MTDATTAIYDVTRRPVWVARKHQFFTSNGESLVHSDDVAVGVCVSLAGALVARGRPFFLQDKSRRSRCLIRAHVSRAMRFGSGDQRPACSRYAWNGGADQRRNGRNTEAAVLPCDDLVDDLVARGLRDRRYAPPNGLT